MKQIKRLCLWYVLLTKRLLKQRVFPAILLLIPLIACAMHFMPAHDGGILAVAVARLGEDAFSADTVARLTAGESVIQYLLFDTEEEAVRALQAGRADAAWIFRADAGLQAARFAAGRSTEGAVKILEREENVALTLSHECLFIAMYPYISYGAYSDFLSDLSPGVEMDEAERDRYYDSKTKKNSLIDYYYVDGTRQAASTLLTAPVRGLLAMVVLLAALASAMIACREERRGVFEHLSGGRRAFVPMLCHFAAIVPTAAASLAAIRLGGLWTDWKRELLTMALYVLSVAAFCEILRILCRSEVTLGALLPILITLMLVLCPVFLHIDRLHAVQYSLPPFYYLNAVLNSRFLPKFALYDLAVCTLAAAMAWIKKRSA